MPTDIDTIETFGQLFSAAEPERSGWIRPAPRPRTGNAEATEPAPATLDNDHAWQDRWAF